MNSINENKKGNASFFYPDHKEIFSKVLVSLKGKRVVVLGHMRPDGDCIGSQVAMCRVLRAGGVDAVAVNGSPIPRVLQTFVEDTPFVAGRSFKSHSDTIAVTVDCADSGRIGEALQGQFPHIFLNIDHHVSNPGYATQNFIVADSAATGEILAGLFFDNRISLDAVTAQALYVAIATDTGQFKFGSTTPQVFKICEQLCHYGAKPAAAALELYEQEPFKKLKLLQHFLSTFELCLGGRVCIGTLKAGVFKETGTTEEDTEGLVDYTRAITGVDIGVLIEEHNGSLKGSLRAKDPIYRVDQVAQIFGGGGHACAAGFNIKVNRASFHTQLLNAIEDRFRTVENETLNTGPDS